MNQQSGFIQFLLGNPLMLLSAGLGVALLLSVIALKVQSTRVANTKAALEQMRAEYAGFRAESERLGKAAEQKAVEIEAKQREVNDGLKQEMAALGSANAELRAHNRRLRERPPVRPDGSEVSRAACGPSGADGAATAELVPLAEYRELEARAAYDAQTVTFWRMWATNQGLKVE